MLMTSAPRVTASSAAARMSSQVAPLEPLELNTFMARIWAWGAVPTTSLTTPALGRRDARYVDAVVTGIAGVHVQVVIRVVEGKGHLGGVVDLAGGDASLFRLRTQVIVLEDLFNVRLRQGRIGGIVLKALVADLQAGVQDGDDHALALVAGAVFQAAQLRGGGLHVRGHLEFRRRIGGGHTGQGPGSRPACRRPP